jgi:PhoPQ-activated pathogenicity-related protein
MVNALLVLALASPPTADPSTALKKYVTTPDSSYGWSKTTWKSHDALRLKSQTWQGHVWEHDVVVCRPRRGGQSKTWVLHVTGSDPNEFDVDWSQGLADQSGCPVAVLFHIPNQPIFDKKEDDLIAHTFEQYLTTGDESWPLLFPMVKSAVKTMDAVQAYDRDAQKFVVFGASKRGWTSWLTAASGDRRVAGIAPMLFDNLKMPQQLAKQMRDWPRSQSGAGPWSFRGR